MLRTPAHPGHANHAEHARRDRWISIPEAVMLSIVALGGGSRPNPTGTAVRRW
jgi:hypothetical protein